MTDPYNAGVGGPAWRAQQRWDEAAAAARGYPIGYRRAPTSDTEDHCTCVVPDLRTGAIGERCRHCGKPQQTHFKGSDFGASDTEDVGEEDVAGLIERGDVVASVAWLRGEGSGHGLQHKAIKVVLARLEESFARLRRTPETVEARIGRLLLDSVTPAAWGTLIGAVVDANDDIDGPLLERLNEIGRALATQDPNAGEEDE